MKKKIVEVDEDVLKDIIVGVFPYLAISLIALIVITYVPQITLFIPRLVYGG